eukprot:scaffold82725_cov57-Phaeocystis_antarctica.AAC.2
MMTMIPRYFATATSGLAAPRERIQRSSIASGETASTPASAMITPRGLSLMEPDVAMRSMWASCSPIYRKVGPTGRGNCVGDTIADAIEVCIRSHRPRMIGTEAGPAPDSSQQAQHSDSTSSSFLRPLHRRHASSCFMMAACVTCNTHGCSLEDTEYAQGCSLRCTGCPHLGGGGDVEQLGVVGREDLELGLGLGLGSGLGLGLAARCGRARGPGVRVRVRVRCGRARGPWRPGPVAWRAWPYASVPPGLGLGLGSGLEALRAWPYASSNLTGVGVRVGSRSRFGWGQVSGQAQGSFGVWARFGCEEGWAFASAPPPRPPMR